MVVIDVLVWNEENIEHIERHNVSKLEVEEVCTGDFENQPTYGNRVMIFGKTKNQRKLTIVLIRKEKNNYLTITARDMSRKERRYFLK